jgi:hypothetical protein
MERHGYRSVVADRIREEYQARVQARLERGSSQVMAADAEPPPALVDATEVAARPQSPRRHSPRSKGELAAPAAKSESEC